MAEPARSEGLTEWWANPAVVGLMGFGLTTMATGLHNVGYWGVGPTLALAVCFGGTAQFVAGRMKSPGYRVSRALDIALLPTGDPVLRETTPETVSKLTLADVKTYHAETVRPDLTTIVVIGDVTPDEAKAVIEKWF